jgi:uncharacterized paraquat-inducible protein A
MGGLLRCDDCGSVSWDVLGLKGNARSECATCGAELKPERRRPGRRPTKRKFSPGTLAERRDTVPTPSRRAPA